VKIENVNWFTTATHLIGIVYGVDEITKEKKAYIGAIDVADVRDEKTDAQCIAGYGAKYKPATAGKGEG